MMNLYPAALVSGLFMKQERIGGLHKIISYEKTRR